MIKYGLKLWTQNKQWFREAADLFYSGKINFIELYIVPDSFQLKELEVFKDIPIILHAPHWEHNFNLFKLTVQDIAMFKNQVIKTADFLNAKHIILHPGAGKDKEIFKQSIAKISDKRLLIENLSKVGLDNIIAFGYSKSQLSFIKEECGYALCFDFVHAAKSALSQKIDYKDFIKDLIADLSPYYFHICGTNLKSKEQDEHQNLFQGDFDIAFVKKILLNIAEKKDIYLVFEVPKQKNSLQNDLKNINYFQNL